MDATGRSRNFLQKAAELTRRDWIFLLIATAELLRARVEHALRPTGSIISELRERRPDCGRCENASLKQCDIARLSWAIAATAARVPWRSDCLLQVMAADRWLRRHSIVASFYLGASKDSIGAFRAHAWLRHGDLIVAGGRGDGFTPLISTDATSR